MNPLLITKSAAGRMRELSREASTETGGILVGTLATAVIFYSGSPGAKSIKTAASFSTDAAHDRKELEDARAKIDPSLKYLGHWHKHPAGLNAPSGGDMQQCHELLAELVQLGDPDPTLLCVILQDGQDAERSIFPYAIGGKDVAFRKLSWTLIDDDAPEAADALRAEPHGIQAADDTHPWINPSFRFQFTPVGLSRLQQEQASIEKLGYQVSVRSRTRDNRVFFELERVTRRYLCIFPPEYPLGAPRLVEIPSGNPLAIPGRMLGWNSDMSVADLLVQLDPPASEPDPPPAQSSEGQAISAQVDACYLADGQSSLQAHPETNRAALSNLLPWLLAWLFALCLWREIRAR